VLLRVVSTVRQCLASLAGWRAAGGALAALCRSEAVAAQVCTGSWNRTACLQAGRALLSRQGRRRQGGAYDCRGLWVLTAAIRVVNVL
jgi:hypothetical protein